MKQTGGQYNLTKIHASLESAIAQSGKAPTIRRLDPTLFSTLEQVASFEPQGPHLPKEKSGSK